MVGSSYDCCVEHAYHHWLQADASEYTPPVVHLQGGGGITAVIAKCTRRVPAGMRPAVKRTKNVEMKNR